MRACVRSFVRLTVHPSRNVRLYTANKRMNLEAPVFYKRIHVDKDRPPVDFYQNRQRP